MTAKRDSKLFKQLLRELPYNGIKGLNQQFKPDESSVSKFSFFHTNIRSVKSNLDDFQCHSLLELHFHFNIIAVTETRICDKVATPGDFSPNLVKSVQVW